MEWVSLPCANIPPRNSHVSVLDGETMVIIGGASPEGQTNDVFTIDLSTRSNLTCRRVSCQSFETEPSVDLPGGVGGVPAAREMHSACAFGSAGTEGARATTVLLMGGRSTAGVLRDLFSLDTGMRGEVHASMLQHTRLTTFKGRNTCPAGGRSVLDSKSRAPRRCAGCSHSMPRPYICRLPAFHRPQIPGHGSD